MSTADNLIVASLGKWSRGPLVDATAAATAVRNAVEHMKIKVGTPSDAVSTLSGGNQQKVVIAKWLLNKPRIILLNDPTRGIDVGTKQQFYTFIL